MMTVSGFQTVAEAEARAFYYRGRGYTVTVVPTPGLAGAAILQCVPVAQ